jgi:D-alanyl-D-alanine carboxypeptidase/D-alanyl-D-alanine-endopeptidase (penicillin-binding protein 4)
MKQFLLLILVCVSFNCFPQIIKQKLSAAIKKLEADSQCEHGIISLYVVDNKTGKNIFDRNGSIGLAPASCQKIITSATAFELLGKQYTYTTRLGYDGKIDNGMLSGNIHIIGSGDPTLGSWRYQQTKEEFVLDQFKNAIQKEGIKDLTGVVTTDSENWESQIIPGGWVWEDIGNYYGAGASAVNWRENQYDLILRSGKKIGDSVEIIGSEPASVADLNLINELTSAGVGTGDNTIIYFPPGGKVGYVRGTIPINENHFVISGSMPDGALQLSTTLYKAIHPGSSSLENGISNKKDKTALKIFYTYSSPPLDSINFWFLKKSINLYGEALLKTIALEKTNHASTDTGVKIVKDFWNKKGIEKTALNIIDGSGLSPANRVTAKLLTTILQYAKQQLWFSSFYNALPDINNIKMKSGSIGGVLSYAGYIKSKVGIDYTFAFIINNFNGSGSLLREKMWMLLDILK